MYYFQQKTLRSFMILVLMSTLSLAQNFGKSDHGFWQNVRYGGGIGLSFGDGFFSGTLAPSAIYEFNQYFAMGLGLNGTYNSLKNRYNSTIFGGSILTMVSPIREIQFSAEFEQLKVSRNWDGNLGIADENYWYPALFIGAGYRAQNVTIGFRYDILYDANSSIYANAWAPFVRVFF